MRIEILSAISHHSVELQAWVLVNVDIGRAAFLSHCEVFARGVHSNGAYTVRVLAREDPLLVSINIVYLIGVTSHVDDNVVVQVVQVEALEGGNTVAAKELSISLGNRRVSNRLFLVVLRVVLVQSHELLLSF